MRRSAAVGPVACFAALGIFWGSWAALIPQIKAQTGSSDGELGLAMLVSGVGAIVAMLAVGRLWQRFGWNLLPVTGLWFAIAGIGLALADSTPTLALALFLTGSGSGALDVAMNAAVSDVEVASGSRLMYGAHALFSLAVLVASVSTGSARQAGASPLLIMGAVAVIIGAVAISTIRSARRSHRPTTTSAPTTTPGAAVSRSAALLSGLAALAILCAVGYLIEDATQNWSALHLERNLGASPALSGAAPGVYAAAMFLGRGSGHRLGAMFGERALFSGGALLAAAGVAALAVAPTPIVALVGLAGAGAGIAMVAPALYGRAGREAAANDRGKAIARLTVFGYTGFIVGPALIGFISQAADLRTAIASLAVLSVGLAIGGWFALRGAEATYEEGEELLKTGRA